MKVLVIGSGMYVCGKGTDGYGTILPALYEAYRDGIVSEVCVASTSSKSISTMKQKAKKLERVMGVQVPFVAQPKQGTNAKEYQKALNEFQPDCTIVSVPDHLHCSITKDALRRGVHAMVVKPLTPTVKEARDLVEASDKHNVYGAVEFHKRFDEANLKMRDVIRSGQIGDVLYITVGYSQKKMAPEKLFKQWASKTDIFQYLGVHYADLIYFATGAEPIRVMATGQKNWLVKKGINTFDSIQVLIEWKDNKTKKKFVSTILTNWIDPNSTSAMSDQKITVVGTKGRYDSDQKNRGVQIVTDDKGVEDFNPYFSQLYSNGNGQAHFQGYGEKSIRQFLNDVEDLMTGAKKPGDFNGYRPTFADGVVSTAIIEAAQKSLRKSNEWITIKTL